VQSEDQHVESTWRIIAVLQPAEAGETAARQSGLEGLALEGKQRASQLALAGMHWARMPDRRVIAIDALSAALVGGKGKGIESNSPRQTF
jgi:hypothetical protein